MKKSHFIYLLITTFLTLSGCGGGSTSTTSTAQNDPLPSKSVSWVAPNSFTDSSPLSTSDLGRYEIFLNDTGRFTNTDIPLDSIDAIDKAGNPVTRYDLSALGSHISRGKTYYVSIRAVDSNGGKSGFSAPAAFSY